MGLSRFSKFIVFRLAITLNRHNQSYGDAPTPRLLTVAAEKSFSRAAEKSPRTQPAISLSISKASTELGEKLIDRSAKDLLLTDAGKIVLECPMV